MSVYRKLQVFTKTTNFARAVKLVTAPLVKPEPAQVRVRNIYVGLNATDVNTTSGRSLPKSFDPSKLPFDVGLESLGVIDSVGSAVPNGKLFIGQPVLVNALVKEFVPGCYSEYSYKSADELYPVPELKPNYLSAVINGMAPAMALDKHGHLKPGEKVLITAAAGGTGQMAVQWAKRKGCYVIGTTSSEEKTQFLYDLGADFVINYRKDNLDQVLSEKFPEGVDVIWETIGGETFKLLLNHLAQEGRMIIVGSITSFKEEDPAKYVHDINISSSVLMRGTKSISGFSLLANVHKSSRYLEQMVSAISDGSIKAHIDQGEKSPGGKFFGLDQIARAHEWLYSGKNMGKVVVQIQEK